MATNRELWEQHAEHIDKYLPRYLAQGYIIDIDALTPPKRITKEALDNFLGISPKDYVRAYGELSFTDEPVSDTKSYLKEITKNLPDFEDVIPNYDEITPQEPSELPTTVIFEGDDTITNRNEILQSMIDNLPNTDVAFSDGGFSDVIIEEFKEYIRGYNRPPQVEKVLFDELDKAIEMASELPNGERDYIKGKNAVADTIRNTPLPTMEDLYTPETADHYMQQLFQNLNLKQEDIDEYFNEQQEEVYGLQEEMWNEFYNASGYANYMARRDSGFTPKRRGTKRRGE